MWDAKDIKKPKCPIQTQDIFRNHKCKKKLKKVLKKP